MEGHFEFFLSSHMRGGHFRHVPVHVSSSWLVSCHATGVRGSLVDLGRLHASTYPGIHISIGDPPDRQKEAMMGTD